MADVPTRTKLDAIERKFFPRLNELRLENRYCDVRLDINGTIFPCHRLVLTASSPYFDTMFNSEFKESTSDTILLKDMETKAFEEILNAIYTAEICLLPSNVYFILKIGHFLLLENVVQACASYIKENCNTIHYLIETCLFFDSIDEKELYSKCIEEIAADLISYSKTDSLKSIPMKDLKLILSKWNSDNDDEESVMLFILEWSKCRTNEATCGNVEELLKVAQLRTNYTLNPELIAQFMIHMNDSFLKSFNCGTNQTNDGNCSLDLSLYLDVVDVKTGQKGWGLLKINNQFDNYALTSFYPTNSSRKKVCVVESRVYCFEYFAGEAEKNMFSTYDENNIKIILPNPEEVIRSYEIATEGTKIYISANEDKHFIMWIYDCATKVWLNKSKKSTYTSTGICEYYFSKGMFYVIAKEDFDSEEAENTYVTYTKLFSVDKNFTEAVELKRLPQERDNDEYVLYAFDNKIVLFSRNEDDCIHSTDIFDLASAKWLRDRSPMNVLRGQFQVTQHGGFLYVIENNRSVRNEKYDLDSNKWFDLPHLPKRIPFVNSDGSVQNLATGAVFGC